MTRDLQRLPVVRSSEEGLLPVPAIVEVAGPAAGRRFLEFFAAHIRNRNTRRAYARAVGDFLQWCEHGGLTELQAIEPLHVAAYIEWLASEVSPPTVKQRLAAIRMLFDWLVVGQVVPTNPAAAVRGPKHVVSKGKTPVLTAGETRQLLDSLPTGTVTGLRDRALIGLLVYTFARVGAAVAMTPRPLHQQRRLWVRLREKGGKPHTMPTHHNLELYLEEYIVAAGIAGDAKGPLGERPADRCSEIEAQF